MSTQKGDLHSFGRYTYANNNPFKFVDPDGNSPITIVQLNRADAAISTYHQCGTGAACIRASVTEMVQIRNELRDSGVDLYDRAALNANIGHAGISLGEYGPALDATGAAGIVSLTQGTAKEGTSATRAANLAKGIPAHELGPSGQPKIHIVEHNTLKSARDAARREVGSGGTTVKHSNPELGDSHFHGVSQDGTKDRVHHEFP